MKRFTTLVVTSILAAVSAAAADTKEEVKWLRDFSSAKAEAAREKRPILVDFTGSDWCGWCIRLDKEVFTQSAFQDYARSNLVLFAADFPKNKKLPAKEAAQNQELMKKHGVRGFPTILLLTAEGKVLGRTGYQQGGAEAYVTHLKELIQKSGWTPDATTKPTEKAVLPDKDAAKP